MSAKRGQRSLAESLNNSSSSLPVHLNWQIKTNICLDEIHQCKFTDLITFSFVLSKWSHSEILIDGGRTQTELELFVSVSVPKIHVVRLISS